MSAVPTKFQTEIDRDTVVITTLGSLGEFQFHEIEVEAEPILQKLRSEELKHVLIDLGATDYCGSAALAFFLKLWKRIQPRSGRLVLCNASPAIRDVLMATRMDSIWPVFSSRSEALAAIRSRNAG